MEEKKQIFRQSSIDRISSPEELNDYVRVANPGVWMIMAAIIILLAGFCIWGIAGSIDTTADIICVNEGGNSAFYIKETDVGKLTTESKIICSDLEKSYQITEIGTEALDAKEVLSDYASHLAGLEDDEWVYKIKADEDPEEGVHMGYVILESISPISFVLN